MKLRIALTGTGYIARIHAAAIQNTPAAKLVAVVNHRPESAQALAKTFGFQRIYPDLPSLLSDGEVDALVVCTPNSLHAAQTTAALRSGLSVLVEKPMALNAQEAYEMVNAARVSKQTLMVAHCWRFDDEVLWLRQQVATGRLGRIVRTRSIAVHVDWGPSGWFTQKKLAGGGAITDLGIHALDTTRFLLGDPRPASVYARLGTYYSDQEVDDTGLVVMTWEDGAVSILESGWWQPHADGPLASTQVYGTRGFGQIFPSRLELPGGKQVSPDFTFPRASQAPQSMYDRQMAAFVSAVCDGSDPGPTGELGLQNQCIIDAAYESSRTGQVVDLASPVVPSRS